MKISDIYKPVRKHKTVHGSISGNYAFRGQNTIWIESTLERDFLIKQEFDKSVIDIVSQPIQIPYITNKGNESTYTPDFLVQFKDSEFYHPDSVQKIVLAEIKPNKKLREEWHLFRPKFKAAMAFAKSKGWVFHIYDETKIRDKRLSNIVYLKRFKGSEFPQVDSENIITCLKSLGSCSIVNLSENMNVSGKEQLMVISNIWHLITNRRIICDMTKILNNETLVWVSNNIEEKDDQYDF